MSPSQTLLFSPKNGVQVVTLQNGIVGGNSNHGIATIKASIPALFERYW